MVPLNTPAYTEHIVHTSTTARALLPACGSRGEPGIARTSSDSRRRRWQDKSAQLAVHLDVTAELIPSVAHQSGTQVTHCWHLCARVGDVLDESMFSVGLTVNINCNKPECGRGGGGNNVRNR